MIPGSYNWKITRGGTVRTVFTFDIDLSGYSAALIVHTTEGDELLRLESPDDLLINTTLDTVAPQLTDEQTLLFDWSRGKWYLELTSPDGAADVYVAGNVEVRSY